MTREPLFVAKDWKDRKLQQALLQPFREQNRRMVREYKRDRDDRPPPRGGKPRPKR